MLPAVSGADETRRQIFVYALGLVAVSLVLPLTGAAGPVYLASAVALGGLFLYFAARLWRDPSGRAASALFRFSIAYLGLLFAAVAVDGLIGL
jgi:protoheme IX farnesyltransferase